MMARFASLTTYRESIWWHTMTANWAMRFSTSAGAALVSILMPASSPFAHVGSQGRSRFAPASSVLLTGGRWCLAAQGCKGQGPGSGACPHPARRQAQPRLHHFPGSSVLQLRLLQAEPPVFVPQQRCEKGKGRAAEPTLRDLVLQSCRPCRHVPLCHSSRGSAPRRRRHCSSFGSTRGRSFPMLSERLAAAW